MKVDRRNPYHWWLLAQQALFTLIAIGARYLTRKPRKPVVVLYGHQFSGNLKALYHEWHKSHRDNFDCYVLCLGPSYSEQLSQQNIQVLQCNRLRDMILAGRSDAIITDHGLHAMRPFISLTSIRFIDVWHGIPFKGFAPKDFRLQHRYNEVWVSSPLLKEIYQDKFGFKPEIVFDLGYARTDRLFKRGLPDRKFREQFSIPANHRIVLYAPTWQQDDKGRRLFPFGESQNNFVAALSGICSDNHATLVIRGHLNARIGAIPFDNVRYCSMTELPDTEGLLLHTDILICDWSSIAFDFLALDRPTIFLDVEPPFKNGFSLSKEYRFGRIAADISLLSEFLQKALTSATWYASANNDIHARVTSAVYGENTDGGSAKRQLSHLVQIIRR